MAGILIVAGEPSGDWYAGELATRLIAGGERVHGVGQAHLAASGARMIARTEEISVVGISEVLSKLPKIFSTLSKIKRFIADERPDLVVLIDFPDFNFRVGRFAHKKGVKVLYYVSPQVWAWRTSRIATIASFVSRMIVLFPFEADIYRAAGLDVEYFGHPFVTRLAPMIDAAVSVPKDTIALLPGSRKGEIERHLPRMIEAARILSEGDASLRFTFVKSPAVSDEFVASIVARSALPSLNVSTDYYGVLARARAAMVASGTATLETGLFTVPMVIVYRLSAPSFLFAKMLIDVPFIGMANIILGEEAAVELIQHDFTAERCADEMRPLIADGAPREATIGKLLRLRALLAGDDPIGAAARSVHELGRRKP